MPSKQALLDFDGTAIVVSHDRYFLNRVVDLLLVFEGDGKVQVIYGNYDTYERMRLLQEPAKTDPSRRKDAKAAREEARAASQAGQTETEISLSQGRGTGSGDCRRGNTHEGAGGTLASPELYREGAKVQEMTQAFEDAKVKLKQLYEHWEEAVELNG